MKYAIIGTGGIGGYYGGKLAHAGFDVHFLMRSDFDYVSEHGLVVDSCDGGFVLPHVNCYNSTSDMPKCDFVIVCMKTTSNHLLSKMLPPILHNDSVVLLIQNGLYIEQELAASLPDTLIAGATAFICTSHVGKGHINHAAYGELTVAPYHAGASEKLTQFKTDMEQAGIEMVYNEDLNYIRWKKLVWNIPYNGLTVVLREPTDVLTANPSSRRLVMDLMREVVDGAAACGVTLPDGFIDQMILATEKMVPYKPSMRLDYDSGREMEIRTMFLNPVSEARRHGYHMSKTDMLAMQLSMMQDLNPNVNK